MVSGAYLAHLADLVRDGEVDEALVDDAVPPGAADEVPPRALRRRGRARQPPGLQRADPGRRALARRAAAVAAHVLVKNDGRPPARRRRVGAAHRRLRRTRATCCSAPGCSTAGARTSSPRPPALRDRLGDRLTVDRRPLPRPQLQLARIADVTVALVGEHPNRSGEANSVSDLRLPPGSSTCCARSPDWASPWSSSSTPAVRSTSPRSSTSPTRCVVAWHPGIEAGSALADVLTGDVAPARPPADDLPAVHRPHPDQHPPAADGAADPGRRRPPARVATLDALIYPRLPFGYGLTYATVEYGAPRVSRRRLWLASASDAVGRRSTNTGDRACREVVQAYFRDPVAQVTRPLVELARLARRSTWSPAPPPRSPSGHRRGLRLHRPRAHRARGRRGDPAADRPRRGPAPAGVAPVTAAEVRP